jgi:hypothetical protein
MSTTDSIPVAGSSRAGALALVVGGVLFAAGNLMHPLQHTDAAYDRPLWAAAHVVILVSIPLILLGLPVLDRALRGRGARTLPPLVAILSVVGFIGMAPGLLVEAYIAPEVGHDAMTRFEDSGFGTVSGILGTSWIVALPILCFALRRARVTPGIVHWSFLAAAVALLTVGAGTSKAAGVAIISATAVYGFAIAIIGGRLARDRGHAAARAVARDYAPA